MTFYSRDWFNKVYHYFIRDEYLGEGRGGLIEKEGLFNFLPLKREGLLEGGGLFKGEGGRG